MYRHCVTPATLCWLAVLCGVSRGGVEQVECERASALKGSSTTVLRPPSVTDGDHCTHTTVGRWQKSTHALTVMVKGKRN